MMPHQLPSSKIRKPWLPVILCLLLVVTLLAGCGSDTAGDGDSAAAVQSGAQAAPAAEAEVSSEASAEPEAVPADQAVYPLTVKDELGHEVTIPAAPERIFAPFMEDSLVVLGVKPVGQWSNKGKGQEYLQDELGDVPLVDFTSGLPSPEVVMDMKPDLIILHNAFYAENGVYEQYSKIAPTYVFKQAAGDLDHSVTVLGELLGEQKAAAKGLEEYRSKVDSAKAELAPHVKDKKALVIRFNSRGMFLMGSVYSGFVLAEELGIVQSSLVAGENSVDLSLELLPQIDADYIFLTNDSANSGETFYKELTDSVIWKSIPAVQAGHVYDVNDHYWLGGGLVAYSKVIDDVLEIITP
ncbi:ferrichrome ABC transporter substrate-binding protein [Paenibacillus sp. PK3_47]|uniref:ABC transporter substrate-binding protein n=1 Tax=Paenibacillus sp. PK3_47 TaxID=2072642 RepID=UPI00201E5DCA|nr:ABC transporter substrate-binding protein [Paenibacillus sp. PK3_47]UQZ32288.1 ferrichrome ABC transporter substrate-binding protein [Paenibacillus sp. PK3_47]